MNRDDAYRWMLIINHDLACARRSVSSCGGDDRFLRNRIAENEAILAQLAERAWVSDMCAEAGESAVATRQSADHRS
jgi:hypothetical protein